MVQAIPDRAEEDVKPYDESAMAEASDGDYMRMVTPEELDKKASEEAEGRQNAPLMTEMASYLMTRWQRARDHKRAAIAGGISSADFSGTSVEDQIVNDYRQRNGQYSPEKLAEIQRFGGSEAFMMLTSVKCRAAEAGLTDVIMASGERPWGLEPTPIAEIDPDAEQELVAQVSMEAMEFMMAQGVMPTPEELQARMEQIEVEAKKRLNDEADLTAERMALKIDDQLIEGQWEDALSDAISDLVTTKAGILKGPIFRNSPKLEWAQGIDGWTPQITTELTMHFERRSPLDIYPSPSATTIQDGYLFDRQQMSKSSLYAMIGVEGYDEGAIRAVLNEHANGGLRDWLTVDLQKAEIEQRASDSIIPTDTIEALEFWGEIPGKLLKEWGYDGPEELEDEKQYHCNAWKIGRWVIKASINEDPLSRRPYSKASYERIPGSFWGRGVPELMRDIQVLCNAVARAIINNVGIASGPQVAINDIDRLPPGEEPDELMPWKVWQFTADTRSQTYRKPMEFFQPDFMGGKLIEIYEYFSGLADAYTGVPSYSYGDTNVGGAGDTASGLSMLMGQASKGVKLVVRHIDRGLIEPIINRIFFYNMLHDPDDAIKGDLVPKATGSGSLIQKEQLQVRRTEFLAATNNPADLSIIQRKGRAAILREAAKALDMPIGDIIPAEEELLMQEMQQQQVAQVDEQGSPAEQGVTTGPDGSPVGESANAVA